MSTSAPSVQLPDQVFQDAQQLREILVGVSALLQTPHRMMAIDAAQASVFEARAISGRIVNQLNAIVADKLKQERDAQAAKNMSFCEIAQRTTGGTP